MTKRGHTEKPGPGTLEKPENRTRDSSRTLAGPYKNWKTETRDLSRTLEIV